jgi:GNAT superfamily N-acetyltransferase
MLADGFHDVPKGRVAAVVTHLEMLSPAEVSLADLPEGLSFQRIETPEVDWYLRLFRRVGAEDWLWFSRLRMERSKLDAILHDPAVEVYSLRHGDEDLGLLELDFREGDACELAFFGLARELIGQGLGRFLMAQAITRAWAQPIRRFHVHTCTLDSPQALGFYIKSGFTAVRQEIEIALDPRIEGLIDRSAAPQIPLFED